MKPQQKQRFKVDIFAVSRAAGVSPATVSRSFNHPELVKLSTRRKIDQAVRRLGYIRNRAAQTIHGKRSATIGLIVPTIDHAIFAEVVQAFSDAVAEAGFTILMATHGYDLEREYTVLRKLLEHRVDGIALIGLDHSEASYQLIEQQAVPAMAIWNYDPASRISCVGVENALAGKLAAQHLISLGHRDIALVFPQTTGNDRARDRLSGALAELEQHGITVPDIWRSETPYNICEAKQVCIELLSLGDPPTALICGNDVIAQGAVFAAQKIGQKVPDDISIIGIGDFRGSQEMEPALTTIRIPAQTIGRMAGDTIAQLIAGSDAMTIRHRYDLQCLIRNTTTSR